MPEPLTIIDARMPATVERWLDAWLTGTPARPTAIVPNRLAVSLSLRGDLLTWLPGESVIQHQDRAALVAYVVTWARDV